MLVKILLKIKNTIQRPVITIPATSVQNSIPITGTPKATSPIKTRHNINHIRLRPHNHFCSFQNCLLLIITNIKKVYFLANVRMYVRTF